VPAQRVAQAPATDDDEDELFRRLPERAPVVRSDDDLDIPSFLRR
jgi:hypothetical protein